MATDLTDDELRQLWRRAGGRFHGPNVETGTMPEGEARCWCHMCRPLGFHRMEMVLCPDCGNKRCPKANNHRYACTGSNDPGQPGSAYENAPFAPKGHRGRDGEGKTDVMRTK